MTLIDTQVYRDRRVTVMGLGRFGGGLGAVRFLAQNGAKVSITDTRTAEQLTDSLELIRDLPLERLELGGHTAEIFADCDMLVVNPAVKPGDLNVRAARERGVDVTTEIELFIRHNPARVIGVTGSNGKSTTTALVHHLLRPQLERAGHRAWLGGNIGGSLLEEIAQIRSGDWVVLELSSFQLEYLRLSRFRPDIAVITNLSPNHLDWHGTMSDYQRAKQGILDAQTPDDAAILPDECDVGAAPAGGVGLAGDGISRVSEILPWRTRGRLYRFGIRDSGEDGAYVEEGSLILRSSKGLIAEDAFRFAMPGQLPGVHNQLNMAAASCAAWLAGADASRFSEKSRTFQPLPHRLQLVAERSGRRFYNDSIATTPESAIQALRVFSPKPGERARVILLAGGYDKRQDLSSFADEMIPVVRHVVLMGQTAAALESLLKQRQSASSMQIVTGNDFPDSFARAVAFSQPGDIVLLSPGCASFGWFRDFRERGELFAELARQWNFAD
ncbi:MAG: UDP-N-acetylmuramoyl-L-alanine--D-glutamate ligase [Planctomyces sp.]|nr:UDP-N-acetylmuramoyl-L-alanine--D-glutamate ligase [Planctomyces sp.]